MNPYILILECTDSLSSVALTQSDKLIQLLEKKESQPIVDLPVLISDVMTQAHIQWDRIAAMAVNLGPGSYTSLRSTLAIVKGIAFARNIKVIPISKDEMMASSLTKGFQQAYIYLYSRGSEVLKLIYDANNQRIGSEFIGMDEVQKELDTATDEKISFAMEENLYLRLKIEGKENQLKLFYPGSMNMINMAYKHFLENKFGNIQELLPIYFKDPNITKPKKIL